jgi:hypothetical protein
MFRLKSAAAVALLLGVGACSGDAGSPLAPEGAQPLATISDAAHAGTVPGFYFLPPMVPNPSYSGTFDGGLQPRVEICELSAGVCATTIAQYTTTSGTGGETVQVGGSSYQVNWHTNQFNLNPAKTYRISVYVGTFRLGFADVDVVASGKELKNVNTQEYIPLQDGRTLPIKFRIETGIAGQVVVAPASASIPVGSTQQFTATVLDLHGNPLACAATWSSSNTGVATVNGSGLATGVAPGSATITATCQAASGSATLTVFNPNTPPVPQDDAFEAIGNVTVPVAAPGVLANDTDGENDPLQAVPGTFATTSGGTVTINADGSFSYLSGAGFIGADSFTYTVTDGQDSVSATVTMTSTYRVWYVDNAGAGPGDGRDASPFNTLAGAEGASTAGETIFVRTGAAPYDGGITLKTGQSLTGQGVPANVTATLNSQTVVLLAAGSAPTVTRTTGGATIQLATNNVVQGVDVASTAGAGIAGSGFGTLTVGSVSVSATGGPALDLSSGNVVGSFDALSSAGSTGAGIRLVGVGGSFSAAGGSITGSAGAGADVTGGAGTFSYGGDIAVAGPLAVSVTGRTGGALTFGGTIASTGSGISVQNNSGGTIAFNGASKSLSTGANPGVSLANNAGAQVSFGGGGLVIGTMTGTGFGATGGGTVSVTGAGNTVASAGGVAVSLGGVGTGASGITFQSVSATGGTSGIVITGITSGAGFQVTGSGSSAGSGGTIQGTSGDAVSLSGAGTVHLSLMQVLPGANGIVATGFSGAAVVERSVIDYQGSAIAGTFAVRMANSGGSGSLTLDGTTVQNKLDGTSAVSVSATGSANIAFTVRDSDTGDAFASEFTNLFGSAVQVASGDAAGSSAYVLATVRDSRFVNAAANGINNLELSAANSATLDYRITGNLFDNVAKASAIVGVINMNTLQSGRVGSSTAADSITGNTIRNIGTGSLAAQLGYVGIRVALDNNVAGVNHRVVIEDNLITNLWRQGILISSRDQANDVNVRIQNNVVGTAAAPVARSNRRGVEIEAQASSSMKVEVLNTAIVNTSTTGGNSALQVRSTGSTSTINATVLGNTIGNTNGAITAGRFRTETVAGTTAQMCLDLRNNTLDGAARLFEAVHAGTGTFNVEGPGNAVVTGADLTAANTVGTGSVTGTPTFNNGTNCAQPSL